MRALVCDVLQVCELDLWQGLPVIEDHLCSLQQTYSFQGEKLRVAWPCTDQVHLSWALVLCTRSSSQIAGPTHLQKTGQGQ